MMCPQVSEPTTSIRRCQGWCSKRRKKPCRSAFRQLAIMEILDRQDGDAPIVAVPDHQHRRVVVDACAAGKDVYCEKPMSRDVKDDFAMVDAVRKGNRIVQVGSPGPQDCSIPPSVSGQNWRERLLKTVRASCGNPTFHIQNLDILV